MNVREHDLSDVLNDIAHLARLGNREHITIAQLMARLNEILLLANGLAVPPPETGFRLHLVADGKRQSDAAAHALRLIGSMMQEAHTRGYSCGGETGNASGNWELI